jgi:hypothetical protein
MRGLVRITCPKCGRDITSRTNQADVTWMHMRSCKGRAQPTTAADAAGSPWGWKLRAEKALAENAALAQQVEELKSKNREIHRKAQALEGALHRGEGPNWHGYYKAALSLFTESETRVEAAERKLQEMREALRAAQWTVHCGQFHQWKTLEQCTEKNCKAVMALIS